jgi:hypothetical protein
VGECDKLLPMRAATFAVLLLATALLVTPRLAAGQAGEEKPAEAKKETAVLVGDVTREQVEAAVPAWVEAEVGSQPDAGASQALASVEPGAEVTVFLGTWCGDSRREVPRLWKALDESGGMVPFTIHYIGVDREKKEPSGRVEKNGIQYVPTFIVSRGGHEVGRIVETSPNGVEKDLLALLSGKATGILSTRDDLGPGTSSGSAR